MSKQINVEKEKKAMTKLSLITGLYLDFVEELNYSDLWHRKAKKIGNNLRDEIKKIDDVFMHGIDIETSQAFVDGYKAINELIDFNLSLDEKECAEFDKKLQKLINEFKK